VRPGCFPFATGMAAADSGDVHDSAEMKIFLHEALMKKLS
jgi:hypothetical protein